MLLEIYVIVKFWFPICWVEGEDVFVFCFFVLEIDVIMFNSIMFEIEDIFGLILCWKFTLF